MSRVEMANNHHITHNAVNMPQTSRALLSAQPSDGQYVEYENQVFTTVKEGLAYILIPANSSAPAEKKVTNDGSVDPQSVFYNPIQQFNRDLSVLAIKAYGEDLVARRKMKAESATHRGRKRKRRGGEDEHSRAHDVVKRLSAEHWETTEGIVGEEKETATGDKQDIAAEPLTAPTSNGELPSARESKLRQINPSGRAQGSENAPSQDDTNAAERHETLSNAFKTRFTILDGLAATGLRALRYAKEISSVTSVTANDLSPRAAASIQMNVQHNRVQDKIKSTTGNVMSHMYSLLGNPSERSHPHGKYDVIDLDPYGTAVPFLDAAVQALNDGGLLCVTCTDAGVWASCGHPEKTYALYGGAPMKGVHSHEGGLRLILHSIASIAAKYGIAIEPLLSLSIDFYARIFVRVVRSPAEVKLLAGKTMLVYNCDAGCGAWSTQMLGRHQSTKNKNGPTDYKYSLAQGPTSGSNCEHCGFKTHVAGPMYAGRLHNPEFLRNILSYVSSADRSIYATRDRIEGMISTALEETLLIENDDSSDVETLDESNSVRPIPRMDPSAFDKYPFFFIPSGLAKVLHCRAPSEAAVKGALRHAGYHVTRSHAKPGSVRTNAPWTFIWEMMREWIRQRAPIKEGAVMPGMPGWRIIQKSLERGVGLQQSEPEPSGANQVTRIQDSSAASPTSIQIPKPETSVKDSATAVVEVVFDENLGRDDKKKRLVRYQTNPRANWGPMHRAKGGQGI